MGLFIRKDIQKTFTTTLRHTEFCSLLKLCITFCVLTWGSTSSAQTMDKELFIRFENHFHLLDSLIFMQQPVLQAVSLSNQ